MKLKLYEIEQEHLLLMDAIIDAGGEITPEQETALEINQQNLETKGRSYGYIIKDLESDIDVIDAEMKRLQVFKVSRNKTIERLKDKLSEAMQLFEIEKLEGPTLKISFRKSKSVEVENQSILDEKFLEVKTTFSVNKTKIKEAIESGENVLGAVLKVNQNIQIK